MMRTTIRTALTALALGLALPIVVSAQDAGVPPSPETPPAEQPAPWWARRPRQPAPAETAPPETTAPPSDETGEPEAPPAEGSERGPSHEEAPAARPARETESADEAVPGDDAESGAAAAPASAGDEAEEAPAATAARTDWLAAPTLNRPTFAEDDTAAGAPLSLPIGDWRFALHGYVRMPLRFTGAMERPPYLVDDNYFLSGFSYTRVNETEWAELDFSVQNGGTRLVFGLFASQFSDWSETTLQGQNGIAFAFLDQKLELSPEIELDGRVGMFWDRYGYVPMYDTYLFGRTHIAGARIGARLFDMVYVRTGLGAHADVITANQGFTPVVWVNAGVDLGFLDVAGYAFHTWTADSNRQFAEIEDGSLTVLGGDVRLALPHFGHAYVGAGFYDASHVLSLANGLEVLHSTGGRGLTQNFFGQDSMNGTGQAIAASWELDWQIGRTLAALTSRETAFPLSGLELRLFGMLATVQSYQTSDDPLVNRDDRTYLKHGFEIFYRPHVDPFDYLFLSFRFDRVILDIDHESMAYRLYTPKLGVTPLPGVDVFVSYSFYDYGERVFLRPNQIAGDASVRNPDDGVFKIQAQARF